MDQIEGLWSLEEDKMLDNLIGKHGSNWSLISKFTPGRSGQSCLSRWLSLLQKEMEQIKRLWSPKEDKMLINLFWKHGRNWSLISKSIPGRSAKTCESRWLSLQRSFTPEEDEMLQNLVEKHGRNWSLVSKSIPDRSSNTCESRWLSLQRSFTPEEDGMLQNLVEKHGLNWSLISKSIPDRSANTCESRWLFFHKPLFMPEEEEANEDITIIQRDDNIFIQPSSLNDINRGQRNSYIYDLNLSLALGGVSDQPPYIGDMAMETGSKNSIYEGNEVGGMVSGQAPSISDMARGNMSSGGTHSYSHDHSAPSWNALYKRDSSPMRIDSDNAQEFVGDKW